MRAIFAPFHRENYVAFCRVFGAALVVNVVREIASGVWHVHTGRLYPYRHVGLFPLHPPPLLAAEWAVTACAGLAMVLGWRRWAFRIVVFALLLTVFDRYSNHVALMLLVSLFVSFDPPRLSADQDAFDSPNLALVRAQILIVYSFTAINKVAHGFLRGEALAHLVGWSLSFARAASWLVVAAEIAIPVLLLVAPRLGVAAIVVLHAAFIAWLPGLESFALTMVAVALLFLPPRRKKTLFPAKLGSG